MGRWLSLSRLLMVVLGGASAGVAAESSISAAAAREGIAELRREIARHDALYHRQAAPEIGDFEYDQLKRRLRALENAFPEAARDVPALAEIGDDRTGLFQTRRHGVPMLSLDKAYTEAELRAFHLRLAKTLAREDLAYVVEPKIDGLAVSVTYERGELVRAVTRGNGAEGDDITANVRRIAGLPVRLNGGESAPVPERIELRGEIHVPFAEFARVNAEREAAGEAAFANPRNLAAGTVRQLDGSEVARRGLRVVFYGVGTWAPEAGLPDTQRELHAWLAAWGLPALREVTTARGAEELVRAVAALQRARAGFAYPTDGAVVKLESLVLQREAGAGPDAPRWAIAYKFAPERAETRVRGITIQVGRTGVLTPVAELEPVEIAGSTVARATLHNASELARRDIRVGDFVYVEKAGEIIPAVAGVNLARRPADAARYAFPNRCPSCDGAVAARGNEVAVRCANAGCPAQLRRRLEHFAAAVGIEGLGPATVDTLVARGMVRGFDDLYRLKPEGVANVLGQRTAERLLAAIEASKRAELWRVITGLGIPQVGAVAARELAERHATLEALAAAEPRASEAVARLLAVGMKPSGVAANGGPLAGRTFVLTGTLPTLTRNQATARIEAAGGKVGASVNRTTDFVVAGENPGATLERARTLGVGVIGEEELLRMIAVE